MVSFPSIRCGHGRSPCPQPLTLDLRHRFGPLETPVRPNISDVSDMCPGRYGGPCLWTSPTDPAAVLLADAATTHVDGKKATPSSVWRHRTILGNAMERQGTTSTGHQAHPVGCWPGKPTVRPGRSKARIENAATRLLVPVDWAPLAVWPGVRRAGLGQAEPGADARASGAAGAALIFLGPDSAVDATEVSQLKSARRPYRLWRAQQERGLLRC